MSKYKTVMQTKGIQQKEVLDAVHRVDPRVDKPLLSKIVNDVCLPTPRQFKVICDTLVCDPCDIYDPREVALLPDDTPPTGWYVCDRTKCGDKCHADCKYTSDINHAVAAGTGTNKNTERTRARRENIDVYNLTAEIPRALAERVFSKDSLRKLGCLSVTDFVRRAVAIADARLAEINKKAAERKGGGGQ